MRRKACCQVLIGDRAIGEVLVDHPKVPLVSATGSTRMGRDVGPRLAKRFARAILELGGNNAGIVCPSADLDMALRAIAFGAMGTAGQRCTTLRRLFVHESVYDTLVPRLKKAYESVSVGNPLETGALVGPLIDKAAFDGMQKALEAKPQRMAARSPAATASRTAMPTPTTCARRWSRCRSRPAPVTGGDLRADPLRDEIQRLRRRRSPTTMRSARGFPRRSSPATCRKPSASCRRDGSDCGIANVNIGTSGAEIGGAFGGEKETGGGREIGLGRLEGLYAPRHQHRELLQGAAAGAGRVVRHRLTCIREF